MTRQEVLDRIERDYPEGTIYVCAQIIHDYSRNGESVPKNVGLKMSDDRDANIFDDTDIIPYEEWCAETGIGYVLYNGHWAIPMDADGNPINPVVGQEYEVY